MKMPNDFAVFILTHGRPDNVITLQTLKKQGYDGRLYFIVDDEDKQKDKYIEKFGDAVIVFNKKEVADQCDEGNNFDERRTILMARNACFDIARQLGVKYFIQLDDDYTDFRHKHVDTNNSLFIIKEINKTFNILLDYFKRIKSLSIAFAQGGDYIGGISAPTGDYRFSKRKCMNSFICSTDRPFKFIGAMNEDVNTYTTLGSRGSLFLTIPFVALQQKPTQKQKGGITDMYLRFGTYCKAFTTVMMMPSSVKVSMMNSNNPRIHHSICWADAVPCIIREELRK